MGAKAPPRPPFAGKHSFARVAKSASQPSKGVCPLPCAKSSPVVVCGQDLVDNIGFYQHCALVCRFFGFWPLLLNLHRWVSDSWKPLVAHNIDLFRCAKGFFIASFNLRLIGIRFWASCELGEFTPSLSSFGQLPLTLSLNRLMCIRFGFAL